MRDAAPAPADDLGTLGAEARRLAGASAWRDVADLLLPHAERLAERPEIGVVLVEALVRTGRAREARQRVDALLPVLQARHDRASLRRGTVLRGAAAFSLGDLDEARAAFTQALEMARRDGDDALVARTMNNLGAVANIEGDQRGALALYKLAISAHQRVGDLRGLAECYHNMAISVRDLGQVEDADELERRSAEFARDAGLSVLVSIARMGRAELALRRGDPSFAEATARRVAAEFAAAGEPVREAAAHRLTGIACFQAGRFEEARRFLDSALARARTHGAVLHEAEALRSRAELFAGTGDHAAALADARSALGLFGQLRAKDDVAALLRWIDSLPG
ncbi:MAG: tetratricopeptide repeat protein [Gemmatimonadales bacterium]|nr:tetratricopeptide repeat protein [Gemmatimonadota bacterium]MCL4212976.1 tetratricopeptide repeat protein [Gemmatimonadales bacterium]